MLIDVIRRAEKITKTKVGILMDLQGPVIRMGEFRDKNTVYFSHAHDIR